MGCRGFSDSSHFLELLEKERALLSRFVRDPTVDGLRAEEERHSTRSKLRVDSGFVSF